MKYFIHVNVASNLVVMCYMTTVYLVETFRYDMTSSTKTIYIYGHVFLHMHFYTGMQVCRYVRSYLHIFILSPFHKKIYPLKIQSGNAITQTSTQTKSVLLLTSKQFTRQLIIRCCYVLHVYYLSLIRFLHLIIHLCKM